MVDGGLVSPGFARSQAHRQIVQRSPRVERALRCSMCPDQHPRRTVARHSIRREVDVLDGSELLLDRQCKPKLKASRAAGLSWTAGMLGAMCGFEPFHAAGRHDARLSVRIFVSNRSFEEVCHGGDSRVWMQLSPAGRAVQVKMIQEHER